MYVFFLLGRLFSQGTGAGACVVLGCRHRHRGSSGGFAVGSLVPDVLVLIAESILHPPLFSSSPHLQHHTVLSEILLQKLIKIVPSHRNGITVLPERQELSGKQQLSNTHGALKGVESFKVEKPCEIMESRHSSNTLSPTTKICPQMPYPPIF